MTAGDEVTPFEVETLDSTAPPPAGRSVVLSKDPAGEVLDYVGGATRAGAGIFARPEPPRACTASCHAANSPRG
jgi:hypothetical protein